MKKYGIGLIVLLVIVMCIVSTTTYAFFSAPQTEFDFVITSETGSVLALTLDSTSTTIKPAVTSATVNNYSVATAGDEGTIAVYVLQYLSRSEAALDIDFSISDVVYTTSQGESLTTELANYLSEIVRYTFIMEPSTYVHAPDNLPSVTKSWISSSGINSFTSVQQGVGYLLCYVKFNVTEALVPPIFDGVKISFTINSTFDTNV